MKTLFSPALPAALAAFFVLPVNVEISGSLLFAVGLLAVLAGDYLRPVRSLKPKGALENFPAAARAQPIGLAA